MNKFTNHLAKKYEPKKYSEVNQAFIKNIIADIQSKIKPQSSKMFIEDIKKSGMEMAVHNLAVRTLTDMAMLIGAEKVSIKYTKQNKTIK